MIKVFLFLDGQHKVLVVLDTQKNIVSSLITVMEDVPGYINTHLKISCLAMTFS